MKLMKWFGLLIFVSFVMGNSCWDPDKSPIIMNDTPNMATIILVYKDDERSSTIAPDENLVFTDILAKNSFVLLKIESSSGKSAEFTREQISSFLKEHKREPIYINKYLQ
jgi:hypothetical protein